MFYDSWSINRKITVVFIVISLVCLSLGTGYMFYKGNTLKNDVIVRSIKDLTFDFESRIMTKDQVGLTNSLTVSTSPDVMDGLLDNSRKLAVEGLSRIIKKFKESSGYKGLKFHIIDNKGISFLKTWDIKDHSQDLNASRPDIVWVNKNKKTATSFVPGLMGISHRSVVPIIDGGEFLGSVEMIQGTGNISMLMKKKGRHMAVFVDSTLPNKISLVDKSKKQGKYILAQKVYDKQFYEDIIKIGLSNIIDKKYVVADKYLLTAQPVKDYTGKTIGQFILGEDIGFLLASEKDAMSFIYTAIIMSVVLVIVLSVSLLSFIRYRVVNRIKRLSLMVDDISKGEGDLTKKIEVQCGDELGVLSSSFNEFTEYIRLIIVRVKESADSVASGNSQLAAASDEFSKNFIDQADQLSMVASAVEEMDSTSSMIVENLENTVKVNESAVNYTQDGMMALGQSMSIVHEIKAETEGLSASVESLSESTDQINAVINVINDIADQTNLLALNAAIEAARAGEAGRGFAVVADEVRKLAERTQKQTSEISGIIRNLIDESSKVVSGMENTKEKVVEGGEVMSETSASFDRIVDAVKESESAAENISVTIREQNEALRNINENLAGLSSGVEESSRSVQQINETVTYLQKEADTLRNMVGRFKV